MVIRLDASHVHVRDWEPSQEAGVPNPGDMMADYFRVDPKYFQEPAP